MRELDDYDRAELAELRVKYDDLRARGLYLSARWAREQIDVITGEDDD